MSTNFKKNWADYRNQKRNKLLKEQQDLVVGPEADAEPAPAPEVAPVVQQSAGTGVDDIDAGDVAQADLASGEAPPMDPEAAPEEQMTEPQLAEQYAKKVASLNEKKAKLEEEIAGLMKEIEHNTALGQKRFQYDEARSNLASLKEEIDEMKKGESLKGGLADGMDNEDIADEHGVSKDDIDHQVEVGKDVEAEHTDDPDQQEEISKDHAVEDPEYYDDKDGLDLKDVEDEAEEEKKEKAKDDAKKDKMDEGKKGKKKKEDGPVTSLNKATGERERIGKSVTPIKSKKDKGTKSEKKRKDIQNQMNESKHRYLKESWKRVKRDGPEDNGVKKGKGKNFNFHIG